MVEPLVPVIRIKCWCGECCCAGFKWVVENFDARAHHFPRVPVRSLVCLFRVWELMLSNFVCNDIKCG